MFDIQKIRERERERERERVRVLFLRELALKLFMIANPEESESERNARINNLFEIVYPKSERDRDAHRYKLFKKANPELVSKKEAELKAMTDLIATERKAAREREEAFTHLPFADHK